MATQEFLDNRARFPRDELLKHRGCWVAFSSDGRRIVASGETISRLEEEVVAAGQDPQKVVLERVPSPEEDVALGGEGLG